MSANRNDKRLPPPAFPPGSRRHVHRNARHPHAEDGRGPERSADPFISPDEPLPPRRDPVQRAFIAPEDPLPERGVVEGAARGEAPAVRDPHVAELVEAVGKLSEALRRKGEAGLRATPGMSRFEATLRSYCVGYLAGRRAESGSAEG